MNVLLVEDSDDDAVLLAVELERGGLTAAIQRVDSIEGLRRALSGGSWDILLTDYNLPGFDAEDVLRELQETGRDLPLIILSGIVEATAAVSLLKRGAHDFVNKQALARLVPAIEREIREAADRAQRREAEERVRILSLAIEQSPVSVVITNEEGVIQYVNPKFEQVTGYTVAEATGEALDFTRMDGAGDGAFGKLWATVRAGREFRGEFCSRRKDGQLFWEHATISPLKSGQGRISHFVAVKEDITVRRSYEERLLRQANFDELTGLPNRVLVLDRLRQAIAMAHRDGLLIAILFIDLDRFKSVNDTLGHAAGDVLLKEAAVRLTRCVREGDTLARMGGDEFLLILPRIDDGEAAQRVAERVVESFASPFVIQGQEHFITASIGITLFPTDGTDSQALLRNADLAMYRAKDGGRNRHHFFTQEINQRMQERLTLEGRLRGAVRRDEMLLHFQPIVDLASHRPVALEALIRWRGDDGQLRMPNDFISVAEDMGLIGEIGDWVVAEAFAHFTRQSGAWPSLRRVAINVSPKQLQTSGFGATVRELLAFSGLAPERVELEITESVLMDDRAETGLNLKMLCDAGVRLAIDDFGTGYSSLGYLQKYPFHTLKIDRSFIKAAPSQPNASRLVEAIITMAHGLGMEVIAEGVETPEQLAFLRARDCDLVQGFLFSTPLAVEDLAGKLEELTRPAVVEG